MKIIRKLKPDIKNFTQAIRFLMTIAGLILLPFLLLLVFTMISNFYYAGMFDRIPHMASRVQVQALMGAPDKIRECGEWLSWGGDSTLGQKHNGTCVEEWYFTHMLTPLDAWSVGFDKYGHVISKYHYVSE